jgi:hypothetical protein
LETRRAPDDFIEETTADGCRIVRATGQDLLLAFYFTHYNKRCFDNTLPDMPVFWAKSISRPDGSHPIALHVPQTESPIRRQYIVLHEKLAGMFPFERLTLLHEMVHAKLGDTVGHGEEFIAEFKRVLDATRWEEMGCIDSPKAQEPT